ncbi:unnamed protein product [Cylindrotheca closterium]|uniref:AAA+ ATPase domain-containing protein n=1 Tax=Cylindrotheca closterium TaxID=2856 RepID=A0AAD2PVT4_9STRA|nr:unnamed protein product [Cylindrotheca closterium]
MSTDKKLLHLVKKYMPTRPDEPPNADYIMNCLTTNHPEYRRKFQTKFKVNVERAIEEIVKADEGASESTSKKRPLEEDPEEEEYEKKAREHDLQRIGETNSLNASLVQKYRKMTEIKDNEAREKEKTEVEKITPKKSGKRKKAQRRASASNPEFPGAKDLDVIAPVPRPSERYSDLGGMDDVLQQIRQLVEYPLVRPEIYRHLGVHPPRGVLLRGPPGCGKTHLSNAIAGQLGVPYFRVSAPELVSGMSGESEARIRDLFKAASEAAPAVVFLDELDSIAPKRSDGGSSRGMEKRMVAQLLTSLDMLDPKYNRQQAAVIVLGATNRPDSIDSALRRAGRFDKEILLGVPDEDARIGILQTMTKDMKLGGDFNFKDLARRTPGYVGADIRSLTKEAAVIAINRIFKDVLKDQKLPSDDIENADGDISSVTPLTEEEMEPLHVTMNDFLEAVPLVQPSSKREGFATVPGVSWDDIGALGSIREELGLSVLEPIRNPEKFQALGIPLPAGVMLYGPPGCGKTLLAKAIANESGANFISVKGPELLDKYVGESERSVRLVFERARSSSPCIVFFDELDSLCPKRGSDGGGGGGVSERVVNQLLTEMDGLESRRSVFVIAATNRPELIDPAMMRPGRLDKLLYVPLPTPDDRYAILKALAFKVKLGPDVDLKQIAHSPRAEGYSGADCAALLREAGLAVLKESMKKSVAMPDNSASSALPDEAPAALCIKESHFQYAFDHVIPSVSRKDQARYNRMRDRMAHARSRGAVVSEVKDEEDGVDEKSSKTTTPSGIKSEDKDENTNMEQS